MTINRLRVGLDGATPVFKLSKPGVNVDTASFGNLLFDMGYGVFSGILLSGQVPYSSFSGGQFVVTYPYTLAAAPKIMLSWDDPNIGSGWRSTLFNSQTGVVCDAVPGVSSAVLRIQGSNGPFPANCSYVIYFV